VTLALAPFGIVEILTFRLDSFQGARSHCCGKFAVKFNHLCC
jgi:hypothetical protein